MTMGSKKDPIGKTTLYLYDPDVEYTYNAQHGTEYPYNGLPKGINGRIYKKTRFIEWEPIPEDIIIRHSGSQIHVNFPALFHDDVDPDTCIFVLRSKRVDLQNLICEQINFFTALYDDDNDLITSMLIAKCITDSEQYTIDKDSFKQYYERIEEILFPPRTMERIKKMVEENDVGDDVVGLFPPDFLRDMFIASFMIKVEHIFIEHFILSTGNSPKDLYEYFARAFIHICNSINPNMYVLLYRYVFSSVAQNIKNNNNVYDMQAIDGVTETTMIQRILRKSLMCDGLIKLTFASAWDKINRRPVNSCVGLIKAIINTATMLSRKLQLRYSLANSEDPSQLLSDNIGANSPITMIRSYNAGEFCCMSKDLNIVIAQIALETNLEPLQFYLDNLPQMNDLSKILVDTVLYNKFHSSISTNTLSTKQKYIILLYVRDLVMKMYGLVEAETVNNPIINIIMGKTVSHSTKSLTKKDLNGIKKFVKINDLRKYLLTDKNTQVFIENIIACVLSSYSIVNHNDPSLLNTDLVYDSNQMTLALLNTVINLFESFRH
jgi:hypothetical protein